jgi:hypothetical protein
VAFIRTNPNSEIIGELNRINVVLQDFITDIEAQDLRRTEQSVQQSVLLVREKYEALATRISCSIADMSCFNCSCISELRLARLNNHLCVLPNFLTNNPALIRDELRLAGKYPDNTTIVHMDENGNYKVVYGLKLDRIPKGDI